MAWWALDALVRIGSAEALGALEEAAKGHACKQLACKAAEQAKAYMLDPFTQAASAAADAIKIPLDDADPPLPSTCDGDDASDDPPAPDA